MGIKRHRNTLRAAVNWIAVLPFLLLTFMAPGTMPANVAGGVEIVLCTGDGFETITIGPDGAPVEQSHAPCFWGLQAHSVAVLGDAIRLPEFFAPVPVTDSPAPQGWHGRLAFNENSARAPPTHL